MRLFARLFLCATLIVCAALLFSGYVLITSSHESALSREVDRAKSQYQYEKFTLQSGLISSGGNVEDALFSNLSASSAVFAEDKTLLYTALPADMDFTILDEASDGAVAYKFSPVGGSVYITVCGKVAQSGATLFLLTAANIDEVVAQKELMTRDFMRVYFITIGVSMIGTLALSALMTKPINRMTKAAAEIARGRYSDRLPSSGGGEIGELSESFNLMAAAIEDKIRELSENARQKEDFVANFAHELKTPLTSVIGYADMLYQKAHPPEKVKEAAWYILSEGMRLEALSLKLMDLIVLGRQEFTLEEMNSDELLHSIEGSLKPILSEKKVFLEINASPENVMAEYDLLKTLLLNLIDNAIKAGADHIEIVGKTLGDRYGIIVADNGRGMPESELGKVTEAFYMVDKSRARKQRGFGLGLALAERIAGIHGTALEFISKESKGTAVRIDLPLRR